MPDAFYYAFSVKPVDSATQSGDKDELQGVEEATDVTQDAKGTGELELIDEG